VVALVGLDLRSDLITKAGALARATVHTSYHERGETPLRQLCQRFSWPYQATLEADISLLRAVSRAGM
jgi:hypothetical protein